MRLIFFAAIFGILNCARGRKLFDLTNSTVVSRLASTSLMAITASFLQIPDLFMMTNVFIIVFAGLMLWCTPAWDKYWSEEIGNDPNYSRLWGLRDMTFRMLLALPVLITLPIVTHHYGRLPIAAGALLLGLPYYIFGYMKLGRFTIAASEFVVGVILGSLILFIAEN